MKTLFHKIKITVMVLALFSSNACNDFLKEEPRGLIMNDLAFSQASDLVGALNALNRQVLMANKGFLNFHPWVQGDDLSTHPLRSKAPIREWDVMKVSDENPDMIKDTSSWYWLWKVIKAANYILNGADKTPDVSQNEINFVKGQAYYWRAYCYFYLVRVWGPVPMILTGDVDVSIKVSKVSEILNLIVSDLQEAEKLPANYTASPWAMNGVNVVVNSGAAKASLAYVYLCMAGWPLNYGTEYYQKAAAKAEEVIDGVKNGTYYYQLYPEYKWIHSKRENLKNKEVILAVWYSSVTGTGDNSQSGRGCINDILNVSGGYNDCRSELAFYCDFPEGDRKEWTFAPVTYYVAKGKAFPFWSEEIPEDQQYPYFRKTAFTSWGNAYSNEEYDHYRGFEEQSNGWSTQLHQVVRLAEVYCWYAEAVGRSGKVTQKAVDVLNEVRNRANGVSVTERDIYPSGMTPNALAEAAYNEHGWEIGGWWCGSIAPRYSDQQRMNRVKDHYNRRYSNPEYIIPNSGGVILKEAFNPVEPWSDLKMYAPYPATDVRMNQNLKNINKFELIK